LLICVVKAAVIHGPKTVTYYTVRNGDGHLWILSPYLYRRRSAAEADGAGTPINGRGGGKKSVKASQILKLGGMVARFPHRLWQVFLL
jgi:hypothetical protein